MSVKEKEEEQKLSGIWPRLRSVPNNGCKHKSSENTLTVLPSSIITIADSSLNSIASLVMGICVQQRKLCVEIKHIEEAYRLIEIYLLAIHLTED